MISAFAIFGAGLWALICVIDDLIAIARRKAKFPARLAGIAVLGGLLYLIPLMVWAYELLPSYTTASQIALALLVVTVAAGVWLAARNKPRTPPVAPAG